MNAIQSILSDYKSVSLSEIEEVKLMNRIDRKYWFHLSKLNLILQETLEFYDVLEINGQRLMDYRTTYLDTSDDTMYVKHHNRKLNRHKVRKRKYLATNDDFLEIKFKTNKKRCIKTRIETDFEKTDFTNNESSFLTGASPFVSEQLKPSLNNQFSRLTLIHKNKIDRCTIDISPKFWNEKGEVELNNLVIFELKRGRSLKGSEIVSILRKHKIRQRGLSKYCTGRALLDSGLKQNAFKPRLRFLNKYILN